MKADSHALLALGERSSLISQDFSPQRAPFHWSTISSEQTLLLDLQWGEQSELQSPAAGGNGSSAYGSPGTVSTRLSKGLLSLVLRLGSLSPGQNKTRLKGIFN